MSRILPNKKDDREQSRQKKRTIEKKGMCQHTSGASKCVIGSIDIGRRNFAQYFEKVNLNSLLGISQDYNNLPRDKKRKVKGPVSIEMRDIIDRVCNSGKVLDMGVYDLCVATEKKGDPPLDIETRKNIIAHLERCRDKWSLCDIIIIEQQFFSSFGGARTEGNIKAIKVGEIVLTWFLITYPEKQIEYFGSQYKTQILGAPDKLTKPQRKKWSIEKTKEILTNRNDEKYLNLLTSTKKSGQKLDDVSDALCQCQAYKLRKLVCKF